MDFFLTLKLRVHRVALRALFGPWLLTLLLAAGAACAQSTLQRVPTGELPDAPQPADEAQTTGRPSNVAPGPPTAPARIKGVVSDIQGGLVPRAHVVITGADPEVTQDTSADDVGFFSAGNLPAGTYSVMVSSPGLETYVVRDIHLQPGEVYSLPEVSLPMARTSADVTVTLTTEQLAEQELHNELHQRVLGVLPNFYVSYQWDAAPLSPRQKFELTTRTITDPVFLATTAIGAGIQLARNDIPEYGPGPAGYWRRYGASYGDSVIGGYLSNAALASVFHQDPRYFVMTTGSWKQRTWHAVSSTFVQRNDNSRRFQPAYSRLLGSAIAGLIASTYHPDSSPGKLVLNNTVLDLGSRAANNLVREFVLRHLAKNIPSYAKGKPPEE